MKSYTKYLVPAAIAAVVIALYFFLSNQTPAVVTVPNTTGSGVNSGTAANAPGVAPYNATIPGAGADPALTSLPAPSIVGPTYLTYNFGPPTPPIGTLNPTCSGGCSDSCQTCGGANQFPDGAGSQLAYNQPTQLANSDPNVWNDLLNTLVGTGEVNPLLAAQYYSYSGQLNDPSAVPPAGVVRPN